MRCVVLGASGLLVVVLCGVAAAGAIEVPTDFPTIQDAVDAAKSGDRIVVTGGPYSGPVEIHGKKRLKLMGVGDPVVSGPSNVAVLQVYDCKSIRVEGLAFESGELGAEVLRSTEVTLKDCTVRDSDEDGVLVVDSTKVKIDTLEVTDSGDRGVSIDEAASRCTVKSVRVRRTGGTGILVAGDRNKLTGNDVANCGNDGLGIRGDRNKVIANRVADCDDDGVELWKAERTLCKGNVVEDIREIGFQVEDGRKNKFLKNDVSRCAGDGFWIDNAGEKLLKNTVTDCGPHGIHLSKGKSQVIGNVIRGSDEFDLFEDPDVRPPNKYRRNTYTTTNRDPPP
jgi:nitrous oxidase accessory protein NosD